MGLFKKKSEVVDLTKLEKLGILQKSRDIASKDAIENINSNKIVDLSETNRASNNEGLGFLNNLAGVGTSERRENSNDLENLKVKIEDIEYKLERLIEKLNKIEERFS